jgi:hypothetical protein
MGLWDLRGCPPPAFHTPTHLGIRQLQSKIAFFFAMCLYGRVVLPATLLDMVEYERKLDSVSEPTRAPIHTKYTEKKQRETTCSNT